MATLRSINEYTWVVAWVYGGEHYAEYFSTYDEAKEFMNSL